MNKIVVTAVATLTFVTLMAVNAQAAILIGGAKVPSGSVISLRGIVKPTVPAPTTPTVTPTTPPNWVITKPTVPTPPVVVVTPPVVTPPVTQTGALTVDEQAMIDSINQQRIAAGVAPLLVDMRLVTVGRKKAADMKANNYFSHTSPTYGSPWAMMQAEEIKYKYAGENIAGNKSVAGAMVGFMNSPGHRANILNPSFTHIGVGIAYGTMYTNTYVQEFAQE